MHSAARVEPREALRHRRAELMRQVEVLDVDLDALDRMDSGEGPEDPIAKALRLAVHAERIAQIARADAEARAADEGSSTERSLLCALLCTSAEDARAVTTGLRPDDFTGARNRTAYRGLLALLATGAEPSLPALIEELTRTDRLEAAGGGAHVASYLDLGTSGRGEAQRYASRIREATIRRQASSALDGPAKLADIAASLARATATEPSDEPLPEPVTLEALLKMTLQRRRMILEPWLSEASLSMLFAERGCGKSWLGLSIALAVAGGGEVFPADDLRPAWKCGGIGSGSSWRPEPRNVLLVDGEMTADRLQDRLIALAKGQPIDTEGRLKVLAADLYPSGLPPISSPKGQRLIEQHVADGDLLILDNLSTLTAGVEENSADDWEPLQSWLLSLRRKGVAVLFVHHAGKGGAQRGSSRREDVLDVVLKLTSVDEAEEGAAFAVSFSKARNLSGHAVETFRADLKTENKGTEDEASVWHVRGLRREQDDLIIALAKDPKKKISEIAEEVGLSRSATSRRMAKLRKEGRL